MHVNNRFFIPLDINITYNTINNSNKWANMCLEEVSNRISSWIESSGSQERHEKEQEVNHSARLDQSLSFFDVDTRKSFMNHQMIFLNKSPIYSCRRISRHTRVKHRSNGWKSDCKIQRKTEIKRKQETTCDQHFNLWNQPPSLPDLSIESWCFWNVFRPSLSFPSIFDTRPPSLTFLVVCLKSALQQTLGFKKTLTVSITRKMTTTWIQNYSTARRKQEWMTSKGRQGRKEAATRFQGRCWTNKKTRKKETDISSFFPRRIQGLNTRVESNERIVQWYLSFSSRRWIYMLQIMSRKTCDSKANRQT